MLDGPRRESRWAIPAAGLLIGLALGLIYFFGIPAKEESGLLLQPEPPSGTVLPGPYIGAPAPELEAETVDGSKISLQDFRGKVVVLNFWATWCAPCREEMPALEARYEKYKDRGLVVLAIDFDEPAEDVRAFRDSLALTFPVLLDPGAAIQQLYRVRGYPTSYFVDRDGTIQVQHVGIMYEDQLDGYLTQLGVAVQ
jgi:cytochrome c biogenesis protein CcmG/thiol:disulfide interchange protein DsbE